MNTGVYKMNGYITTKTGLTLTYPTDNVVK